MSPKRLSSKTAPACLGTGHSEGMEGATEPLACVDAGCTNTDETAKGQTWERSGKRRFRCNPCFAYKKRINDLLNGSCKHLQGEFYAWSPEERNKFKDDNKDKVGADLAAALQLRVEEDALVLHIRENDWYNINMYI